MFWPSDSGAGTVFYLSFRLGKNTLASALILGPKHDTRFEWPVLIPQSNTVTKPCFAQRFSGSTKVFYPSIAAGIHTIFQNSWPKHAVLLDRPLTRYAKLWVAHALVMPGTFSPPPTSKKPPVSDPRMYHGTCVKQVPWCTLGSLTCGEQDPLW